ncbi:Glyceraldehyde 3-phosphate phosphatase [uncultured archaeon]|nr:Glyceraldehyde 3-phosphate phosphatase [uncultured archaeon]
MIPLSKNTLQMTYMIKAVIYDLDGVLVDATEWHYDALNRALKTFGYEITREEHMGFYNGLPSKKKLEVLSQEKGFPLALKDFVNDLKQIYTREEVMAHCKPDFQKRYMLARFKKEGYKQAVCSNALKKSIDMMLNYSGLTEYVDFVLGNDMVVNHKPHPEMYLKALEHFNLKPTEAVIVEDSPHGIQAAHASGAYVCEVSGYNDVNYFKIKEFIDSLNK